MSIIDVVETLKTESPFDVVAYVSPEDERGFLLGDMQDHFNTLHAVCKSIKPKQIFGFNLNFGYGMAALLHSAPEASFAGVHAWGTTGPAVEWAAKLGAQYRQASISPDCNLWPDGSCDLLYIAGTEDGDYLFTVLDRYALKSKWIIASIEQVTPQDSMALAFWLRKYSPLIKSASLLPGRKGLWLVEMKSLGASAQEFGEAAYKGLEQSYTGDYYLTDCGGYAQFRRSNGKDLSEPRLVAVNLLVNPGPGMRILDVGCGRGELAYALASAGAEVVAMDYSVDAINLAIGVYGELDLCKQKKLVFERRDLFEAEYDRGFDVIVAADFIEHIDNRLQDEAIRKLRSFLKPGGRLIIHTAPNLLHYRYAYKKRCKLALQAGSYLPPNPRSFYEQVVHINEQTPARLKRLLRRNFLSTITWVASDSLPMGTLVDRRRNGVLTQGLSIYSIASNTTVTRNEIMGKLSLYPVKFSSSEAIASNVQNICIAGTQRSAAEKMFVFFSRLVQMGESLIKLLAKAMSGEQRSKK